jgi:hypothetical protein
MTATSKILPEGGKRLLCYREITRLQCLPERCKVDCDLRITERSGSDIRIALFTAPFCCANTSRNMPAVRPPDRRCPAPELPYILTTLLKKHLSIVEGKDVRCLDPGH